MSTPQNTDFERLCFNTRMSGHQLNGIIQISGFEYENTTLCLETNMEPLSEGLAAQYCKHVSRGEEDLNSLGEHIDNNPAHWLLDENNLESGIAKGRV